MNNYRIGVDVWEGELQVDWDDMPAVDFAIIRLNDTRGTLHKDENFDAQWAAAGRAGKLRAPYVVYSPWETGQANYNWLMANLPADAGRVFSDVELRRYGYSPATYAGEFEKYRQLVEKTNPLTPYTGRGFIDLLSKWPKIPYWWANYLTILYSDPNLPKTWEALKIILDTINPNPPSASWCPGPIAMWQISGDRLILPGSSRPIDVNVFFGTYEELKSWIGGKQTVPVPEPGPDEDDAVVVATSLKVRTGAGTNFPSIAGAILRKNDRVEIITVASDKDGNAWANIGVGKWAAMVYFGQTFIKRILPPSPVLTFPHLYKILDDIHAGVEPNGPRPYLRNGLPSTVPLFGGAGDLQVPESWIAYLRTIMTKQVVEGYLFRDASGWQNGSHFGHVRELTFSGNIVNVLSIEGNKAYVETIPITYAPPNVPVKPTETHLHRFIHMFSIQYDNHLDMTTDGRFAYIILFSLPGERLWMDVRNLVRL